MSPLLIEVFTYLFPVMQLGLALLLFRSDRYWAAMVLAGSLVNVAILVLYKSTVMDPAWSLLEWLATIAFFTGLLIHAISYRAEQRHMAELERSVANETPREDQQAVKSDHTSQGQRA